MKKLVCVLVLLLFVLTFGCGSDKSVPIKTKDGDVKYYTFQQYGLFDMDKRNPKVEYKVIWGNVFWGVVLCESFVAPIIIFGWYLYEPIGPAIEGEPGALSK